MKPFFASSASRRSVIAISVGHLMSWPPSSVGNVWHGRPASSPPDSTPRMREHHPYILNERVMLTAIAYAELAHTNLSWRAPSVSSSKSNDSTGLLLAP